MVAGIQSDKGKALALDQDQSKSSSDNSFKYNGGPSSASHSQGSTHGNGSYNTFNGGYHTYGKGSSFRGRGKGLLQYNFTPKFSNGNPGILGTPKPYQSYCPDHLSEIPTCQICNKKGHVAADCFQRHNTTASNSHIQCQICWKYGHSALQCYHRGNFAYQGRPPTPNLTAMHANHQPSAPTEQFWIADTGATSHMTSELANLDLSTPYQGSDTITTASGAGLHISNIGTSTLVAPHHSLTLKNVLHVPKLSQHLLSIYQLCKDNKCRFICDDVSFWVQDKSTGKILLQGLCKAGYYPIPFISSHKQSSSSSASHSCFLAKPVHSSIWHKRLGHTSNAITSAILHQSQVPASLDTCSSPCTPCLEGKFTKLPFSIPVSKSVHPLEKIHSDVWGPAPLLSYEGFRYYVTFIDDCTRYTWIFPL
ncbi:hypothetical protein FF2_016605 [Malus domestica]